MHSRLFVVEILEFRVFSAWSLKKTFRSEAPCGGSKATRLDSIIPFNRRDRQWRLEEKRESLQRRK